MHTGSPATADIKHTSTEYALPNRKHISRAKNTGGD